MLKIIDSKEVSEIKIKIDDYIPLLLKCLDIEFQPLLYWRIGNFKKSLLEIGINPQNGTLVSIVMPLAGKINPIYDYREIEKVDKLSSTPGIPIADTSNWEAGNSIKDEIREIKVSVGKNNLIIHLEPNIFPTKTLRTDNVKFGINSEEYLVMIAVSQISESDLLKIV